MFLKCDRAQGEWVRGRCGGKWGQGVQSIALLATWQASGKLFILQQLPASPDRKCRSENNRSCGGVSRASVKEINGLKIGKST